MIGLTITNYCHVFPLPERRNLRWNILTNADITVQNDFKTQTNLIVFIKMQCYQFSGSILNLTMREEIAH